MPFIRQTDTTASQPLTDTGKIFIGRRGELLFFVQNTLKPEEPTHNIISISGQGGVGKTTLLTRLIAETHSLEFKDYCLTAIVDERQTTPASIMEKFADQLHIEGDFKKALKQYKEALHKLQTEQETIRDTLLQRVPNFAGASVEGVPFVGPILRESAKAITDPLLEKYHTTQIRRDAARLEDPIEDLTKAFVAELNQLTNGKAILSSQRVKRRRRVILFFDTFEQLAVEAAPWLLDYFLEANISNNIVLVIAGRDPIDHSASTDPKRWLPYHDSNSIYSIFLNSFTEDETYDYLTERGITKPDHLATIWQLSRGLPLYLGLLTSNPQGEVDLTKNVVDNFLRWIPEQEQVKRRLALDASLLSKPFNQDDLEAFSYLSENERSSLYRWLIGQPFVRSNPQNGLYTYHELAKELFSRHLNQRSKKEYYSTRRALVDHYQRLLEVIQMEKGIKTYQSAESVELALALAHQLFLLQDVDSHTQAIKQILYAYKPTDIEQTGEIARVLRELSQEHSNDRINSSARQIARQLLQLIEAGPKSKERLTAVSYLLEKVSHTPAFPPELLTRLYDIRSISYSHFEEYQQAIEDCNRSLELDSKDAKAYQNRGFIYMKLQDYQQAIANLDRALELDAQNAWSYNWRGACYRDLQNYQQAITDLNHALKLDPKMARAYFHLGVVYQELNDYQKAITYFDRALELSAKDDWTSVRAYYQRSSTYIELHDYQQAIADLDQALKLGPQDAGGYSWRGFMYMKLRDYHQAIANLDRALELNPKDAIAFNHRGVCYRGLQNYQQAITDLNHALELNPKLARAYYHLGVVYQSLHDYQQAVVYFDQALKLNAQRELAYFKIYRERGFTYMQLQDYQQAIADLDRALKTDPQDAWAHLYRGISHRELQNYQQAITDLNHALELDPKLVQAYIQRGNTYLLLKDIEQAIDDFDCSWKLDPTDVNNGWMTEWTKMCVKRPDPGLVERLEAIAAVNPQCYEAYVCRGVVLLLRQRFEEALAELEIAIPLKPQVPDAYFWKGIVFASLGQDEEAMSMLKKALKGNLLPVLVAPFHQLKQVRSGFYEKYVISLLADY